LDPRTDSISFILFYFIDAEYSLGCIMHAVGHTDLEDNPTQPCDSEFSTATNQSDLEHAARVRERLCILQELHQATAQLRPDPSTAVFKALHRSTHKIGRF
jgi:hypothetical protein